MAVIIHLLYTFFHSVLLIKCYHLYQKSHNIGLIWVLIPLMALVYENIIIAVGGFIGVGPLLEMLNLPRFLFHVLLTPLWIMGAVELAKVAQVGLVSKKWVQYGAWLLIAVLVLFGFVEDFLSLELEPVVELGTARYTAIDSNPPIGAISTIIVVAIIGFALWAKIKWPWLAIASLVIFFGNGLVGALGLLVLVGNGLEVVMGWGLVSTGKRVLDVDEL